MNTSETKHRSIILETIGGITIPLELSKIHGLSQAIKNQDGALVAELLIQAVEKNNDHNRVIAIFSLWLRLRQTNWFTGQVAN